jgi:SAM-dependent methyltransferase
MATTEDADVNTTELAELATLKQGARATWAAGDYPEVAKRQLWEVGPRIVRHVDVRAGDEVLDVACGTGNAAIRAAQAGGSVVGVDLTPELFDAARRLAAEAGVFVDWVQGDAEELPFADESFDVVVSTFGCMFAPRHAVTAQELARVLRPGGRLGICSWTPDGAMGEFFRRVGGYMPPPSPLAEPPPLWGSEPHVEELFDGTGIELEFEREVVQPPAFESPEAALEFLTSKFGPLMMARQLTEALGRWPELRGELIDQAERDEPAEYLVVIGRRAER